MFAEMVQRKEFIAFAVFKGKHKTMRTYSRIITVISGIVCQNSDYDGEIDTQTENEEPKGQRTRWEESEQQ